MNDCLFCKISRDEIPANKVFENENILAFRDIQPQAPTHILIIPRQHIATTNDLTTDNQNLIAEMLLVAKDLAQSEGLSENGYRLVFNCNKDGGQAVYHIHLHLLGGRKMSWPPG
ncbi:histidine triad nucleotide-binding protein [candidate division KSB1 bacterium]|nr:histidine triad nucleotide-binding protein [candidate division KSB1 bacterium]